MTTLFLDIEAVPIGWQDLQTDQPPEVAMWATLMQLAKKRPPGNYGPEAQVEWLAKQLQKVPESALAYFRRGSLDSKRGQVLCVGYAIDDQPVEIIWEPSELENLTTLHGVLGTLPMYRTRIVTWGGDGYDFPFLWERGIGYELYEFAQWFGEVRWPASKQLESNLSPAVLLDAHKLWRTTRESSGKLQDVASFLGVSVENPIDGGQVLDCMLRGEDHLISSHCSADVDVLRKVWIRMARGLGIRPL
jgi:hypothetical protein